MCIVAYFATTKSSNLPITLKYIVLNVALLTYMLIR